MAAQITVSCEIDGEVKVWATAMSLLVRPDGTGHYVFRCPDCREMVTREAPPHVVKLLRSVHVAETKIRPHADGAPRLTEDDLIDFGRSLHGGDPWAELGASQPG